MSEKRRSVYAIDRAIWDDPDFPDERFSEREAWMWLIGAAAWKEIRTRGNAGPVKLGRGEFSFAVRFLAGKWGWDIAGTHRFVKRLEKRNMIRNASRDGAQIYSIRNYNNFQVVGLPVAAPNETELKRERNADETPVKRERNKEETGETGKQETEQQEPPAIAVASKPALVSRETSKALVVVQSLPDWLPLEAWTAYLEMRRKKRAKPTPHAINLILKELDRLRAKGHDPTEILNTSTRSNWTDIYEPKDGKNGNSRHRSPSANDKNLAGAALAIESLNTDDVQCGQTEGDSDAGGSFLPFLDPGFHAHSGGG